MTTLDFEIDPSIQVTSADVLNADMPDYFDTPATGVTRQLTVRVIDSAGGLGERTVDLTTVLRQ